MWVQQMYHENKLSHTNGQQLNKTIPAVREAKFHSLTSGAVSCLCFTLRSKLAIFFNLINKTIINNNPVELPGI